MRLSSTVLLLAVIAAPLTSSATIVFSDDFSTNGALLGSTPDVGGNWTITGTNITNPLTVNSTALSILTSGQDGYGGLSPAVLNTAGTSVYTGLDINLSAAQLAGDYFLHLSDPAGTTTNFYQRVYARSSGTGFQLGLAVTSGAATYGTTVYSFGTKYRIVGAWNFVSGAFNDTMTLYVNPTNPVAGSNSAEVNASTWGVVNEPSAQVSAVNFRQGSAASAATLTADNLIVATTFAEAAQLAAIPEPSAYLFGALATMLGGAAFGRRMFVRS